MRNRVSLVGLLALWLLHSPFVAAADTRTGVSDASKEEIIEALRAGRVKNAGTGTPLKKTVREVVADLLSDDSSGSSRALTLLTMLNDEEVKLALSLLPEAFDLDSGELDRHILTAYERIGRAAEERMSDETLAAIRDGNKKSRLISVQRIKPTENNRAAVINELGNVVSDSDVLRKTRMYAAGKMAILGADAQMELFPRIEALLAEPGWRTRKLAVRMLGNHELDSEQTVPLLQRALLDNEEFVSATALAMLFAKFQSARTHEIAVRESVRRIMEGDRSQRENALDNMLIDRKQASSAVGILDPYLRDGDDRERILAILTLGRLGPEAAASVDALTRLSSDDNQTVVALAEEAISCITQSCTRRFHEYLRELGANPTR